MTGMVYATTVETLNLVSEGCSAEIAVCAEGGREPYLHLTVADLTYQLSAADATNLASALSHATQALTGADPIDHSEVAQCSSRTV